MEKKQNNKDKDKNNKEKNNKEKNNKEKNNNEQNNKLLIKLNEIAEKEFERYISYLELPSNLNDKEFFVKFLFNDVLTIQVPFDSISISELFEDPSFIINSYFDKVKNKNNFNNLLNTIKLKFIEKKKILKEKIKECNHHLKIIKNEFINIELENILANKGNTYKKFTFFNKKVLIYPETNKLNYSLSEIFARYIFTSINNNSTNIPSNSVVDNFYEQSKILSFINDPSNPTSINPFSSINNNFKYWIFIIFLISTLFAANSDYTILFNNKEFEKFIDKLVILKTQKKKDSQGQGKGKKKKHRGGSKKGIGSILQSQGQGQEKGKGKNQEHQKKNIEESSEKKLYKEIFNKCYVSFQGPPLDNKNLLLIYNGKIDGSDDKYLNVIKEYFEKYKPFKDILAITPTNPSNIGNSAAKSELRKIQSIPNLFLPQEDKAKIKIDISDIGKKDSEIKLDMVKSYIHKIISSFDIFQSLRMLQDKNNYYDIKNFMKELRKKLILLLYNLYKFKKNIYEKFIENLNIEFLEENNNNDNNDNNDYNDNNNLNKEKNRNISKNTKKVQIQNNFNYSIQNNIDNNIKNNIIQINKEIISLKSKLKTLNEENINYEKKTFEIQSKINELYAKRYALLSSA